MQRDLGLQQAVQDRPSGVAHWPGGIHLCRWRTGLLWEVQLQCIDRLWLRWIGRLRRRAHDGWGGYIAGCCCCCAMSKAHPIPMIS